MRAPIALPRGRALGIIPPVKKALKKKKKAAVKKKTAKPKKAGPRKRVMTVEALVADVRQTMKRISALGGRELAESTKILATLTPREEAVLKKRFEIELKERALAKKKAPVRKLAPRADLGAPIDGFFGKQGPQTRPILEALRKLVEELIPEAKSSLKWGMPFYTVNGNMVCALGGHKSHVNLILSGPPGTFADPKGLLEGAGKTGRHLKLTRLEALPVKDVKGWLRTAAELARSK